MRFENICRGIAAGHFKVGDVVKALPWTGDNRYLKIKEFRRHSNGYLYLAFEGTGTTFWANYVKRVK